VSDTGKPLRVSIVTPSFNRIRYLKAAMDSVLDQKYPALEYVIVDGGSTDGSAQLIASYADRLAWSVSERDQGQYDAINKGFAHTSGEIMAWLNSDDLYLPWTFSVVAEIFAALPEVEWLATAFPIIWNEAGLAVHCGFRPGYSNPGFLRGEYLPRAGFPSEGYIQQETTFWRRSLWQRCGGTLDTSYRLAADYDLWMRFSKHAQLYAANIPLGGFRRHGDQRNAIESGAYAEEAERSLVAHGGRRASRAGWNLRRLADRLPRGLKTRAASAGLIEKRPLCVNHDGWCIEEA
jgi:hypothetical protein